MVAVRVMEMSLHQVVDMIAMGHCRVAAAGAVNMPLFVPAALMGRGATVRMGGVDLKDVFVDMTCVGMVQVPVVQVIDVIVMLNRQMSTTGSVLMVVVRVDFAVAHSVNEVWRARLRF